MNQHQNFNLFKNSKCRLNSDRRNAIVSTFKKLSTFSEIANASEFIRCSATFLQDSAALQTNMDVAREHVDLVGSKSKIAIKNI